MSNITGEINQVTESIIRGVVSSVSHIQCGNRQPDLSDYRTAAAQDIIDATKQDKLIAGSGITIAADGKTISATGGGGSGAMTVEFTVDYENPIDDEGGYPVTTTATIAEIVAAKEANMLIEGVCDSRWGDYMQIHFALNNTADLTIEQEGVEYTIVACEFGSETTLFDGDSDSFGSYRIIGINEGGTDEWFLNIFEIEGGGSGGGTWGSITGTLSNQTDLYNALSNINTTLGTKGTYSKPSGGIPLSDLASAVQTSLGKANTALQPADVTEYTAAEVETLCGSLWGAP